MRGQALKRLLERKLLLEVSLSVFEEYHGVLPSTAHMAVIANEPLVVGVDLVGRNVLINDKAV